MSISNTDHQQLRTSPSDQLQSLRTAIKDTRAIRRRSLHHQQHHPYKPTITFETLPPEIRSLIYSHLFSNVTICINHNGIMFKSRYPIPITCVSRLIRHETLPYLRTPAPQHRIRLECEGGRFPDSVRRRIPSSILRNIGVISLYTTVRCLSIIYDEIKPTSSTFPNLETLELDLRKVKVCMVRMMTRHARRQQQQQQWVTGPDVAPGYISLFMGGAGSQFGDMRRRDEKREIERDQDSTGHWAWCVEVKRVLEEMAWELHVEQERPREGLERDYFAEHSLFEFLMKDREKRGFKVRVWVDQLLFTNHLGVLPGVRFDWDDVRED